MTRPTRYLPYLLLAGIALGCSTRKDERTTPVSFEMKKITAASPGGCQDGAACASFDVSYPQFSGWDSLRTLRLAAIIDTSLMRYDDAAARGKTMRQQADDFIKGHQDLKAEMPALAEAWHYKGTITPLVLADSLVSLEIREEYYTGGAHGGSSRHFINIRPESGADVTLTSLLKSGYEEPLTRLGEKIFRDSHNLSPTASLLENSFEFPDDKFQLPSNYGFAKDGIVFYYNSYEIGPYSSGPTELIIPYTNLKQLMR